MDTNAQLWYIMREYISNSEVFSLSLSLSLSLYIYIYIYTGQLVNLAYICIFEWNPIFKGTGICVPLLLF